MTDAAALWPTANPSPFSPFVSPAGRQAVPRSHSASHRATPGLASLARGDEISAAPIPSPGWAREALRSLFGHDLYRKTGSHFCGIMHLIHPARGGAGSREAGPYVSVQPLGCPRAAIFWRRLHNPFFAHGTAMRAGFASTSAPFPPSPQSRLRAISRIGLRSGDDPGPLANTPAAPRNPRESRAAGQHFRTRGSHGPDLQPWASQPHGGRSRNPWAWDRYSRRACGLPRDRAIARGLTQAPRSFPTWPSRS